MLVPLSCMPLTGRAKNTVKGAYIITALLVHFFAIKLWTVGLYFSLSWSYLCVKLTKPWRLVVEWRYSPTILDSSLDGGGQLHAPAACPHIPIEQESVSALEPVWTLWSRKISFLCLKSNPDRPARKPFTILTELSRLLFLFPLVLPFP
jgi:hypothetical protein